MRISLIVILAAVFSGGSLRQPDRFDTVETVQAWMTDYYRHPEPQRIVEVVRSASGLGLLRDRSTAPPMFGFLAGWFSENEGATDVVMDQLVSLPSEDQPVLIAGLWYSDAPGAMKTLEKVASRMPSHAESIAKRLAAPSHGIAALPLERGPWAQDALWGYFYATGKEAPVVRLMEALSWVGEKGDALRLALGAAARWSLTSNAVRHPRVLEICRSQVFLQPTTVAAVLKEIIKDAEKDPKKDNSGRGERQ